MHPHVLAKERKQSQSQCPLAPLNIRNYRAAAQLSVLLSVIFPGLFHSAALICSKQAEPLLVFICENTAD